MQVDLAVVEEDLDRRMGIFGACTSNMLNMIGVGPFLSIPLILVAVHGSKVLLAWILGAAISLCDGLVWAELGSAMPYSGGPYFYLRHAFGAQTYGRAASFLVLWSSVLTAPLLIASGAVGFSQYFHYLRPSVHDAGLCALAMAVCLINVVLLYRRITTISAISIGLWILVVGTIVWIIIGGAEHIPSALRAQIGGGYPVLDSAFWKGVGAATLIAVYDYAGYYNVCLIGAELKRPERTIPYSIIVSILMVAILYIAMNLAILGVLPVQQSMHSSAIVADFMQTVYGAKSARVADVLILVASFASVFAILLGYSRIPFAAAKQGEFFSIFAKLHPTKDFPHISLVILGVLSACACMLSLSTLISLVIVIQAMIQFLAQCVAVVLLRRRHTEEDNSTFLMPLYPLPVVIAFVGWLLVLISTGARDILIAFAMTLIGVAAFLYKSRQEQRWPFEII
ncbi:APC family permease [Tunturibacter empetritectus]|uniref:Amino acid transporter n=1 Tax=Tunturiibacter empetritectus TaxID=3069691 RepID=A0A7W8IHQ6_9BACT|nr:amino acid permease [Edaphobacter lichenicola]MBB5317372.1 amino acid transporter [Edaphobacter lichenicola]